MIRLSHARYVPLYSATEKLYTTIGRKITRLKITFCGRPRRGIPRLRPKRRPAAGCALLHSTSTSCWRPSRRNPPKASLWIQKWGAFLNTNKDTLVKTRFKVKKRSSNIIMLPLFHAKKCKLRKRSSSEVTSHPATLIETTLYSYIMLHRHSLQWLKQSHTWTHTDASVLIRTWT